MVSASIAANPSTQSNHAPQPVVNHQEQTDYAQQQTPVDLTQASQDADHNPLHKIRWFNYGLRTRSILAWHRRRQRDPKRVQRLPPSYTSANAPVRSDWPEEREPSSYFLKNDDTEWSDTVTDDGDEEEDLLGLIFVDLFLDQRES